MLINYLSMFHCGCRYSQAFMDAAVIGRLQCVGLYESIYNRELIGNKWKWILFS